MSKLVRLLVLVALVALAAGAGAGTGAATVAPLGGGGGANFKAELDDPVPYGGGDCCIVFWYGQAVPVSVKHIGSVLFSAYVSQCTGEFLDVCSPSTYIALSFYDGDSTLVLECDAPNIGTLTTIDGVPTLAVEGTWSVQPGATGRFANYEGSGACSMVQSPTQTIPTAEHFTLTGTLKKH
jgi:hypothetical protein